MKSRLVLLDANIIIEAHRVDLWRHLVAQFEIVVPSFILENEVKYFKSDRDTKNAIDLATDAKNGLIKTEAATTVDFQKLYLNFNQLFVDGLDAGEKEALALLYSGRFEAFRFCTGDGAAIKAMSVLELQFQGVSFENLLKESGQNIGRIGKHFQEDFFKKRLAQGQAERDACKKKK